MRRPNVCGPFHIKSTALTIRNNTLAHTISQSEFFFSELFEWLLSVNPFLFCSPAISFQWQYLCDGFRCECAVFALSIFHTNSQQPTAMCCKQIFRILFAACDEINTTRSVVRQCVSSKIIFQFIP